MISEAKIALVGQGRIGAPLAQQLTAAGSRPEICRLDSARGLLTAHKQIETLLICVAPGRTADGQPKWSWPHLLGGLAAQIRHRKLSVRRLIFVSSTRVYEGYKEGIICAGLTPNAISPRGLALVEGERLLRGLSGELHLVRCSGLYGPDYRIYEPIMLAATDRPRFGVEQNQVVAKLAEIVNGPQQKGCTAHLLTDGNCYFRGQCWPLARALQLHPEWEQQFALLQNSATRVDAETDH